MLSPEFSDIKNAEVCYASIQKFNTYNHIHTCCVSLLQMQED